MALQTNAPWSPAVTRLAGMKPWTISTLSFVGLASPGNLAWVYCTTWITSGAPASVFNGELSDAFSSTPFTLSSAIL